MRMNLNERIYNKGTGVIMKNQTYVILALIFIIFISVFSVLNVNPVEVNYLFWKGETPLVFVILISVLLGGILTTAVGTGKFISLRRENKQLKHKITHLEKTIEQTTEAELSLPPNMEENQSDTERTDGNVE